MNILIFGASITYGAWDREGGWTQRLRKHLDEKTLSNSDKHYYLIYNLGISGDTTENLLERFDFESKQRLRENKENIIFFSIGVNDSQLLVKENRNKVDILNFEKNIKELIEKSKKISKEIIFIGLMPVDEDKTSPILWATNVICKNTDIEKYNNKIKEICEKEKVKFIDFYDEVVKMDYKKLLYDGLHPNTEGHKWIAEKVIKELNF